MSLTRRNLDFDDPFFANPFGLGAMTRPFGGSMLNDWPLTGFGTELMSPFEMNRDLLYTPPSDFYETPTNFHIHCEFPGIPKEEIQVSMNDGIMNIHAEHKEDKKEEEVGFWRRERKRGRFDRNFRLGMNADENNVSTKYANGVLEITVGKKDVVKGQKKMISIN